MNAEVITKMLIGLTDGQCYLWTVTQPGLLTYAYICLRKEGKRREEKRRERERERERKKKKVFGCKGEEMKYILLLYSFNI